MQRPCLCTNNMWHIKTAAYYTLKLILLKYPIGGGPSSTSCKYEIYTSKGESVFWTIDIDIREQNINVFGERWKLHEFLPSAFYQLKKEVTGNLYLYLSHVQH